MAKPETSDGKQKPWLFQKGQSGNPAGRPKGRRHAIFVLAEQWLDGQAEQLIAKATSMALAGDVAALRLRANPSAVPRPARIL